VLSTGHVAVPPHQGISVSQFGQQARPVVETAQGATEIGKRLPTVAGSKMQPEEGSARSIGGALITLASNVTSLSMAGIQALHGR
jgi:hypothetical protein